MNTVRDVLALAAGDLCPNVAIPSSVIDGSADLEQYPPVQQQRWAVRIRDTLLSLDRYVSAKYRQERPFHGNFYTFCSMTHEATIPATLVKLTESSNLMSVRRFAEQRRFPVDHKIDPTGRTQMQSHVVIQRHGSPAPRMYFLDGSLGPTSSIHIGYVGKHLDNHVTTDM